MNIVKNMKKRVDKVGNNNIAVTTKIAIVTTVVITEVVTLKIILVTTMMMKRNYLKRFIRKWLRSSIQIRT